MFPLLAIIFGLFGAVIDESIKTPFIFQCLGATIGYVIWVRERVSSISNNKMSFGASSSLWILIVTWCTTFFSGAPVLGLQSASEMSEFGALIWTIVSFAIGIVIIYFHWKASQSAKAEFLAYQRQFSK